MGADLSVITGIGVQCRGRRHEDPGGAIPPIDLHADGIRVEGQGISIGYLQAVAQWRRQCRRGAILRPCAKGERQQRQGQCRRGALGCFEAACGVVAVL